MAGTRSSARQANTSGHNFPSRHLTLRKDGTGTKRKSDETAVGKAKRGRKGGKKQQTTLEETMPGEDENEAMKDVEMEDAKSKGQDSEDTSQNKDDDLKNPLKDREDAVKAREDAVKEKEDRIANEIKEADEKKLEGNEVGHEVQDTKPIGSGSMPKDASKMDSTGKIEPEEVHANGQSENVKENAVEKSPEREKSTPSSILEKGIIYFFFRGRVGIDEPSDVGDIARSYLVLRPLPHGAKLGDGPIGDAGNNRLLALPKKVLPVSPKDRFMIFVEKANSSMDNIKTTIASSDYVTQTAGARHTPAATPIGEGVYAITTTGRESHLAYILTIPSELSEVQRDVGLRERGSFVTSVKNPQYAGPANTNLPQGPNFPQEILEEFRSLRWMPLQPKLLDYENTQFLVIGSGVEDLSKATDQQVKDEKNHKDTPLEEMEKLEHEDEIRVEHLQGDDSIFEDLGLNSKEYPKVRTTW